jgi:hypothetical protein
VTEVQFGLYGVIIVLMMLFRPVGLIPEARHKRELEERSPATPSTGSGTVMADNLLVAAAAGVHLVAVSGVDFVIPRAIVGDRANGAGKTTFFNMLTGVCKPTVNWSSSTGHHRQASHQITKLGVGQFQEHPPLQYVTASRTSGHAPSAQRHLRLDLRAPGFAAKRRVVDGVGSSSPSAGSRAVRTTRIFRTATSAASRWRGPSPRIRSSPGRADRGMNPRETAPSRVHVSFGRSRG